MPAVRAVVPDARPTGAGTGARRRSPRRTIRTPIGGREVAVSRRPRCHPIVLTCGGGRGVASWRAQGRGRLLRGRAGVALEVGNDAPPPARNGLPLVDRVRARPSRRRAQEGCPLVAAGPASGTTARPPLAAGRGRHRLTPRGDRPGRPATTLTTSTRPSPVACLRPPGDGSDGWARPPSWTPRTTRWPWRARIGAKSFSRRWAGES